MLVSIPLGFKKFLIAHKMNFKLKWFENTKPIDKLRAVFFDEKFRNTRFRWRFFMGFKNMTEWGFVSNQYLQLELGEGTITRVGIRSGRARFTPLRPTRPI